MTNDDGQNDGPNKASETIDRLGGIRAVAEQLGLPIVTVQGWKRQGVIPEEYREAVETAERNAPPSFDAALTEAGEKPAAAFQMPQLKSGAGQKLVIEEIKAAEARAIQKGALITILLLAATAAAAAVLLWPAKEDLVRNQQQVEQLEQQTAALQRSTQAAQQAIPTQIKEDVTQLQSSLNASAQKIDNAAGLENRVAKLEAQVAALASPAALQAMLAHVASFQQNPQGQQMVRDAVHALAGAAGSGNDNSNFAQAAQQNPAAKQLLSGVAPEDMKAAALLLGLAHLRFALGRDDVPFDEDLTLMEKTLGTTDPGLDAALDRLEPLAASGVLTPEETAAMFTAKLGANIITAQGKEGNASLQDRALTRLGDVVQVHKDGALVDGSNAQEAVDKARADLAHGDLAGADSVLHGLQGPAAEAAAPWLKQADATLLAQNVATMLTQRVSAQLGSNGLALTTLGAPLTSVPSVTGAVTPAPLVNAPAASVTAPASAPAASAPPGTPAK